MFSKTDMIGDLIGSGLEQGAPLRRLYDQVCYLQSLQTQVHQQLPEDLASHVQVSGFRRKQLTLHVDSGAWATRLRMEIPALRKHLAKLPSFQNLTTIRVRLSASPALLAHAGKARTERQMSKGAVNFLHEWASNTQNPELQESLKRLAAAGGGDEPAGSESAG